MMAFSFSTRITLLWDCWFYFSCHLTRSYLFFWSAFFYNICYYLSNRNLFLWFCIYLFAFNFNFHFHVLFHCY